MSTDRPATGAAPAPAALLVRREGAALGLTLNRPARLNALDLSLRLGLAAALEAAAADPDVRAVVLTGAGERAFCAGQDLNESRAVGEASEAEWLESWHRLFTAFLDCPKPLLAALNGVTAGGGLEMALFCDLRLTAPHVRLIMAEIDVGLPAMTGIAWLSAHVLDSRMLHTVLTGLPVLAADAHAMGLVHEVVAPDRLLARAMNLAGELAAKPAGAMDATVRHLREVRRRELARSDLMNAMVRYQSEAMASGEPQRLMSEFLGARPATDRPG